MKEPEARTRKPRWGNKRKREARQRRLLALGIGVAVTKERVGNPTVPTHSPTPVIRGNAQIT